MLHDCSCGAEGEGNPAKLPLVWIPPPRFRTDSARGSEIDGISLSLPVCLLSPDSASGLYRMYVAVGVASTPEVAKA